MEFSRSEYWSELLFPALGDLPDPGVEPASLVSPALAGGLFTTAPLGKPTSTANIYMYYIYTYIMLYNSNNQKVPTV